MNDNVIYKELEENIKITLSLDLPPSYTLQIANNYAYVFPVDPEKPVRIVFEDEPIKKEKGFLDEYREHNADEINAIILPLLNINKSKEEEE